MRVVIHTPRWFMLGNKDIQTRLERRGYLIRSTLLMLSLSLGHLQ
jgi:hypothetical protein